MARMILHSTRVLAHVKKPILKKSNVRVLMGYTALTWCFLFSISTHIMHHTRHYILEHLLIALDSNVHVSTWFPYPLSWLTRVLILILLQLPLIFLAHKKVRQLLWRSITLLHVTHTLPNNVTHSLLGPWKCFARCYLITQPSLYIHVAHCNA